MICFIFFISRWVKWPCKIPQRNIQHYFYLCLSVWLCICPSTRLTLCRRIGLFLPACSSLTVFVCLFCVCSLYISLSLSVYLFCMVCPSYRPPSLSLSVCFYFSRLLPFCHLDCRCTVHVCIVDLARTDRRTMPLLKGPDPLSVSVRRSDQLLEKTSEADQWTLVSHISSRSNWSGRPTKSNSGSGP